MCNFFGSSNRFQAPLSPTPWSVERSHCDGMAREARVVDADGEPVTDYIALADAEAIVAAMNMAAPSPSEAAVSAYPVPVHYERLLRGEAGESGRLMGVAYRCQLGAVLVEGLLNRTPAGWQFHAQTIGLGQEMSADGAGVITTIRSGAHAAERIALASFRSLCRQIARRQRHSKVHRARKRAAKEEMK